MAAEVSAELGLINDEDVLRKMWQQTEDFGKKKEIRARMYKLREQRLKEFYTTDVASDIALTGRKHAATHHVDSIADQGFMSMKTKEIRDSESPTRDIHKRQSQNNYWNTVQESYSTADDGGRLIDTYEKSMSGQGVSPDGRTYSQSSANQKHQHSSNLEETENSTKIEDQQSRSSQAVVDAHTKTDNGDVYTKASKQEEQKKSSSYTTSKTGNTTYHSSSKQESSSSSSYTKQSTSTSTSNTYQILPSGERVLVSSTTVSNPRAISDETNSTSDSQNVSKYQDTTDFISNSKRDNQTSSTIASDVKRSENISNRYSESTKFISNETADVNSRNNEVKNSNQTYTTESTDRNVCDRRQTTQNSKVENESSNVVDQKIMSELHKLDSYLSTQNATGASTPVSPNSVTGDAANWTVVSSSDGEFVYKSDKERASPGDKPVLIKHPTSLELPKEATEGQYVTTYQQSYQPKKISVEHSPTHDAFARSLRTSPPPSNTRSSSKGSLDRSSPDRKFQKGGSPTRRSPDKERRVSVAGSYTIEKPKEVKRKVSEATYDIQKDTTVKAKRKFSTTQAKSISKVRSSTPGTSPSTSPTRMNRDRSSSSDSESDSSQLTYNKKTSTIKRSSSRKSPVNKDQSSPERSPTRKASSPTKSITQGRSTPESRPRPSSPTKSVPEKASSPSRKSPSPSNAKPSATSPERAPVRSPSPTKTTGILRKDSKSDSASTILIKSETVSKSDQITDETQETTTNTLKKKTEDDSQVSEFISKLKQEEETQKKAINSSQTKLTDTVDESNVDEDVNKMTYHTSDEITITKTSNTDEDEGVTEITTNNIDSSITDRDSVREDSVSKDTSVSREDVVLSQGVFNNEVSKTETQDFIKNEKRGTTSPSCQPSFRDKSPEYSSEGSVTKEIKAARGIGKKNVSTPDSSPERSAFTPIKEFRTEPELKDKINVKVQPSKYPAGAPSPVSPRPSDKKVPDQTAKSRESSPTKSVSPSRSVSPVKQIKNKSPVRESKSSSVSPYSSPERSPTKKTKPADTHKPSSQPSKDTDKTKSVNQRTNRRSSIPRAENVTSVTRKVSEKKIELSSNKKPTTRVPSFEKRVPVQKTQNVRSDSQSSITRKTVTTRSDSQSSVTKKTVTKTVRSSSARDMNTQKSTTNTPTTKVKTTAIINLQRPSNKSLPVQKVANNVVNVTVTTKGK
ncbi:serine-rich adhesin for platelets-like [Nilaparvata lugens]|uniref:serine-rich adhesin for platelets-like n=1 Tax=Nilaparvata lugens TaxID=108931 RepID=UPI00193DFB11|nr:serine-rich adhesin for platelets-like [Nilaparvata lugens]